MDILMYLKDPQDVHEYNARASCTEAISGTGQPSFEPWLQTEPIAMYNPSPSAETQNSANPRSQLPQNCARKDWTPTLIPNMKALFKVRRLWTLMVKRKLKVHVSNKLLKAGTQIPLMLSHHPGRAQDNRDAPKTSS
jgi:hypothetical protein